MARGFVGGGVMATEPNHGRTTVEIDRKTHRALDKLNNNGERYGDTVRAALRYLKEAEPDRLEVEL